MQFVWSIFGFIVFFIFTRSSGCGGPLGALGPGPRTKTTPRPTGTVVLRRRLARFLRANDRFGPVTAGRRDRPKAFLCLVRFPSDFHPCLIARAGRCSRTTTDRNLIVTPAGSNNVTTAVPGGGRPERVPGKALNCRGERRQRGEEIPWRSRGKTKPSGRRTWGGGAYFQTVCSFPTEIQRSRYRL